MTATIRAATTDHAPEIAAIQIASARDAYRHFLPAGYLSALSLPAHEALWHDRIARQGRGVAVWVAADPDAIVGFCATTASDEQDAIADTGELGFLYVIPELVSRGIGRQLLAHAVGQLAEQGFRDVTLWVFDENHHAKRFYERAGWSADGAQMYKERGGASVLQLRYHRRIE